MQVGAIRSDAEKRGSPRQHDSPHVVVDSSVVECLGQCLEKGGGKRIGSVGAVEPQFNNARGGPGHHEFGRACGRVLKRIHGAILPNHHMKCERHEGVLTPREVRFRFRSSV
jgi:hypothetical protein